MHRFTATEVIRLDAFLAQKLPQFSRGRLQTLITHGAVEVNGLPVSKPSHKLSTGETILLQSEPEEIKLTPTPFQLPILFEDQAILVVNKPSNLVVHPTTTDHTDSVAHQALSYVPSISAAVLEVDNPISRTRPGIVHRLDKDTTGVLLLAKTKQALERLSKQFQEHSTTKSYLAICYGTISKPTTINANLVRRGTNKVNKMKAVRTGEGRPAITHVTPVSHHAKHNTSYTILSCTIETGRTHQIRAHLLSIGHPILGDTIYCTKPSEQLSKRLHIARQMLHAQSLSFRHPITNQQVRITAPIPADMQHFFDTAESSLVA